MIVEFAGVKPTPRALALLLILPIIVGIDILYYGRIESFTFYLIVGIIGLVYSMKLLVDLSAKVIDKITVKRVLEGPFIENRTIRVRIVLANNSWIPLFRVTIKDSYPSLMSLVSGSITHTVFIAPHSSVSFDYAIRPIIGRHKFGYTELIISDLLGLFNCKFLLDPLHNIVEIKPKPMEIPATLARITTTRGLGFGKTMQRGLGQEFYTIREYRPGDNPRYIDWKSYARLRRLYVKEFEREANLSIIFVVDASSNSLRSIIGKTPFEHMARIVAGLLKILVKRGDWFGVVIRSREIIRSGYGRGIEHYYRVLGTIAKTPWLLEKPGKSLGEAIIEETLLIPRRTKTLFLVLTSLLTKNEALSIISAYEKLRSLGHLVYVIQLQPELFEFKQLSGIEAAIYFGLTLDEINASKEMSELLAKKGIPVVITGPSDMLESLYTLIERYRSAIV
ncbi:MAG: DUF58 domain-containing protein [Thermoprotei archaeon]